MKIVNANIARMYGEKYGHYSKLNNEQTKNVGGIEVPGSSSDFTEPYLYRSALYFDDTAGVKRQHIGVTLRQMRKEANLSRVAFAKLATDQASQYGIELNPFNIQSYETKYVWKDKYTGEKKLHNACSPKVDKLLAVVLARMALTNESYDEAYGRVTGYTKVRTRNLKVG